jgi:phosphate transport system substrate-binding protein
LGVASSKVMSVYIKNDHVGQVPGLMEYVSLFMSDEMIGPNGALKRIGLVPLPHDLRKASQQRTLQLVPLEMKAGKLTPFRP